MGEYWEKRYVKDGEIWGMLPSITVARADEYFTAHECRNILVPGCGYGRNANFFQKKEYHVTGIDISESAIFMARRLNPKIEYVTGSVFDVELPQDLYDGIYAFNFLHFMLEQQRKQFIRQYMDILHPGGVGFFTVFSEEEKGFGQGVEVEQNTFETRPGRPSHYFTREDLLNHFSLYTVIGEGLVEEPENHLPDGHHIHYLRYIALKA